MPTARPSVSVLDLINPEYYSATVKLLRTIVNNILSDRLNPKFRRINEESAQFKAVMSPALVDYMMGLGFITQDNHLVWPFKAPEADRTLDHQAWARLDAFSKSLNAATGSRISREELARITEERLRRPQPEIIPVPPPTPSPPKLSTRGRIRSMSDIEKSSKVPTHFAEQYLSKRPANKGKTRTFSEISNTLADPAYLGRLAVDLTNKFRVENNLAPLAWDESVFEVVQSHAEAMAAYLEPFSHDNADRRFEAIGAKLGMISSAGENIAMSEGSQNVAATAVDGWIESPGHRKNLLGQFTRCAVGVAADRSGTYYLSQIFIST